MSSPQYSLNEMVDDETATQVKEHVDEMEKERSFPRDQVDGIEDEVVQRAAVDSQVTDSQELSVIVGEVQHGENGPDIVHYTEVAEDSGVVDPKGNEGQEEYHEGFSKMESRAGAF